MDPPLLKAEPFSSAGGASVKTYLRRNNQQCSTAERGGRQPGLTHRTYVM